MPIPTDAHAQLVAHAEQLLAHLSGGGLTTSPSQVLAFALTIAKDVQPYLAGVPGTIDAALVTILTDLQPFLGNKV
jgi:hypothetical protein